MEQSTMGPVLPPPTPTLTLTLTQQPERDPAGLREAAITLSNGALPASVCRYCRLPVKSQQSPPPPTTTTTVKQHGLLPQTEI